MYHVALDILFSRLFSAPSPIIGNYDMRAIHACTDDRSGLIDAPLPAASFDDVIMTRLDA